MGRKIPARKHHGVRDPIKQHEQREFLIKDKINHPPEKQDYQKVSYTLANFIKLKDDAKSGIVRQKRNFNEDEDKPENYPNKKQRPRNNKDLPEILRHQNEPDEDYLRRVNRITRQSIQESQFEAKYGVDVIRNPKSGEISLRKRPQDELEAQMKKSRKENQKQGDADDEKKKKKVPDVKISVEERRKLVKEMMKKKKQDAKDKLAKQVVEYKKDEVKFGEVVHGPPTLTAPKKAQKAETVPRPGKKASLILHSVIKEHSNKLSDNEEDEVATKKTKKSKVSKPTEFKKIDLKGKRKELPTTTRQMIEMQQKNVMDLYRELKKKNRKNELLAAS